VSVLIFSSGSRPSLLTLAPPGLAQQKYSGPAEILVTFVPSTGIFGMLIRVAARKKIPPTPALISRSFG
jgi:hypothetical protein